MSSFRCSSAADSCFIGMMLIPPIVFISKWTMAYAIPYGSAIILEKKHLSYRYNVMMNYQKYRREIDVKGMIRHYLPPRKIDKLVDMILEDRQEKMIKYGPFGYANLMQRKYIESQSAKGFWTQAKPIN